MCYRQKKYSNVNVFSWFEIYGQNVKYIYILIYFKWKKWTHIYWKKYIYVNTYLRKTYWTKYLMYIYIYIYIYTYIHRTHTHTHIYRSGHLLEMYLITFYLLLVKITKVIKQGFIRQETLIYQMWNICFLVLHNLNSWLSSKSDMYKQQQSTMGEMLQWAISSHPAIHTLNSGYLHKGMIS